MSRDSQGPFDVGALRDACRLAVEVARAGEQADPPIPAPTALRPVLAFAKLPAAALAVAQRAVEEDEDFRARVAAAAGESDTTRLGPAGWLWLARPDGWLEDPAIRVALTSPEASGDSSKLRRRLERAEDLAAQSRAEANAARLHQQRIAAELARCQADLTAAESGKAALETANGRLQEERNQAVRRFKAVEADLAEGRRQLKVSRAATVAAEAELQTAQRGSARSGETGDVRGDEVEAAATLARRAAQDAVDAAAGAVAALVESLDETLVVLRRAAGSGGSGQPSTHAAQPGLGQEGEFGFNQSARPRRAAEGGPVGMPSLPPGILRSSDEGHRHVVTSGEALIVIDGYNLARTAWADLWPEEERRRTVSLVEELAARSGASIVVVFDGDDQASAPAASRWVRVEFSGTGETADEAIADLVLGLAPGRPTLVVSSDREVVEDAGRKGAQTMSSASFLRAIGR